VLPFKRSASYACGEPCAGDFSGFYVELPFESGIPGYPRAGHLDEPVFCRFTGDDKADAIAAGLSCPRCMSGVIQMNVERAVVAAGVCAVVIAIQRKDGFADARFVFGVIAVLFALAGKCTVAYAGYGPFA
jgi:hypothetical protein